MSKTPNTPEALTDADLDDVQGAGSKWDEGKGIIMSSETHDPTKGIVLTSDTFEPTKGVILSSETHDPTFKKG